MAIFDGLVNLNVLPIQGIPVLPQSAKDVLMAFGLVLQRLWEVALAYGVILSPADFSMALGHPGC
jgi:hypothetical protein